MVSTPSFCFERSSLPRIFITQTFGILYLYFGEHNRYRVLYKDLPLGEHNRYRVLYKDLPLVVSFLW